MKKIINISKSELKKLYEKEKLAIVKISKLFNCSRNTIYRRLKKYSLNVRGKNYPKFIPKKRLEMLYSKHRLSAEEISKKYSCNLVTVLNRLKEYGIKVREYSEAHIRTPKYDFGGDLIEKAYMVGFRLGDLHARKYGDKGKIINVSCGSSNKEQINLIKNLFSKYCKITISKPNKKGIMQINANLNSSFNFLLKKEDKIDNWIVKNKNSFFAFLADYSDAEGSIRIHNQGFATFRIRTYDKNILNQIKNQLLIYGLDGVKLAVESKKGTKMTQNKRTYYNNKDCWGLCVYKKSQLLKLYNELLPFVKHGDKKKAILRGIANITSRNERYGYLRMSEVY